MNFKPKLKTLKNGLRLVTLDLPHAQSVTALLMVKVGSRYEDDKIAGISHFLEHLVSKGTKKYKKATDIATVLDSIGAEHNAFTSKEYTGFYVKSASIHLPLALDVLSQLVCQPLLREKDIQKEKGVILEEFNMYNDMPMVQVARAFEELIYPSASSGQVPSPLGREVIGYKKSILDLKRKDFLDFRNNWYEPERMILGIVGGISKTKNEKLKMKNLIDKYFNLKTGFAKSKPAKKNNLALKFKQQEPKLKMINKKTQQAHLCLGFRSFPKGHKDRYVMAVLTTILGGNMSSRLFTEIREDRGLAYYIKSNVVTYFDNGYFITQAGVDINKIEETIKVILQEFRKLIRFKGSKIKSSELNKAKEYFKGKLALSLEDSQDIAGFFVEDMLLENKLRTPKEIIEKVKKVSIDDINRVAKKIFINAGLNLVIVGSFNNKNKFEKLLKV